MSCGPLHGIKVVESAHMLSGPYCSQILGDMGASVVKVESTGRGDRTREGSPFSEIGHVSYTFLSRNRNKRSVRIDLSTEEGSGLMYHLLREADVFVHNLRRDTMKGLGLSYEALQPVNPRLVYASISGFGDQGPYKDLPGQDMQVQAMSGILSITGYPDRSSTPIGTMVGDASAAIWDGLRYSERPLSEGADGQGPGAVQLPTFQSAGAPGFHHRPLPGDPRRSGEAGDGLVRHASPLRYMGDQGRQRDVHFHL